MGLDRREFLRTVAGGSVGTAVVKQPAVALAEGLMGPPESLAHQPRYSAQERRELDFQTIPLNEYLQRVYDQINSEIRVWMCDPNGRLRYEDEEDPHHFARLVGHDTPFDYGMSRSRFPFGIRSMPNEETYRRTAEVLEIVRDSRFQKYVEKKEGKDAVLSPRRLRILVHDYQKRRGDSPTHVWGPRNEEKEARYFARLREQEKTNPTPKQKREQEREDAEDARKYEQFIQRIRNEGPIPHLRLRDYETPDGSLITMIDTLSGSVLGEHYDPSFFADLQSFSNAEIMGRLARAYANYFSSGDSEVTILYPAAGDHIAGLELGMSLLERGAADCVNYTFTDIDEEARDTTVELLRRLSRKGLFEIVSESTQGFDVGEETTIELGYADGLITLTYALNRSGGKTFRQSQLDESDIILIHDALWNFGKFGWPQHRQREVLKGIQKSGRADQVVIHDWATSRHPLVVASDGLDDRVSYDMVSPVDLVVPGMYGHVDDHPLYPGDNDHLGATESIMENLKPKGAKLWVPFR